MCVGAIPHPLGEEGQMAFIADHDSGKCQTLNAVALTSIFFTFMHDV
jgi:hypothetical protein